MLIAIDSLKDAFVERVNTTGHKLDIHLIDYNEKRVFVEYRLNGNEKLIEHKFNHLAG